MAPFKHLSSYSYKILQIKAICKSMFYCKINTLLKLLCYFNKQMHHIWVIFLFFSVFLCDIVPKMTNLVLKQQSSFNSVANS